MLPRSLQGIEHLSLGAVQNGVILLCGLFFYGALQPSSSLRCSAGADADAASVLGGTLAGPAFAAFCPCSCRPTVCNAQASEPVLLTPQLRPTTVPHNADIFWVFATPVMVSVAKNFDAPIKLLFPRPWDTPGAWVAWDGVRRCSQP